MLGKVLVLFFLFFSSFSVMFPVASYAICLDDEDEDIEDVSDLLVGVKNAVQSEEFSKAKALLKEAKRYAIMPEEIKEAESFVTKREKAYYARIEREKREKERLARLKREREERARRARLASQGISSYSGSITLCYPSIPRPIEYSECSGAKTASGKYATVQLKRGGVSLTGGANCYDLTVYTSGSIGNGNTCGGVNGSWSMIANGQNGFANGLGNAIAWLLRRM